MYETSTMIQFDMWYINNTIIFTQFKINEFGAMEMIMSDLECSERLDEDGSTTDSAQQIPQLGKEKAFIHNGKNRPVKLHKKVNEMVRFRLWQ